jgi:hypothetical protein
LVAALVAVAAGVALLVMRLVGSPGVSGQLLTITKPTGGTITSRGINCGTSGSDCSTTLPSGEPVELQTHADTGFMFTGYTGDCLSTGRTLMTSPRTCGGTFAPLPDVPAQVARLLTITRPKGGTILSAGIQCGTLGSDCSATHPDGEQVTLYARADEGFTFQGFTGECGAKGQLLMSAPRTCGATFVARASADASRPPAAAPASSLPARPPAAGGRDDASPPPPENFTSAPAPPSEPAGSGAAAVGGFERPLGFPGATPAPAPPIAPEVVVKANVDRLLKGYCSAYEQLDVPGIMRVFPTAPAAGLREQFRQYKTAGCALAGPPEFVSMDPHAGIATVEVGVKLSAELKVGSTKPQDTIAVVRVVRPEPRGEWHIESMRFRPKR